MKGEDEEEKSGKTPQELRPITTGYDNRSLYAGLWNQG